MKFLHLSDLHIGKFVHGYSMLEDQEYILREILSVVDCKKPDAVLISGDIYDRSIPPTAAVRLFDDFLAGLVHREVAVYIISGNHDSAERLAFGHRFMQQSKVFISPVYNGKPACYRQFDTYGVVNFYLLPFVKPATVRNLHHEAVIESWTDSVRVAIENMNVNTDTRNVLLAHQFVTGAFTCESEELSIGGSDNVDASVFADFDYVALGHLHGPQRVGTEHIYYSGSPLKYSFSEVKHKKSVLFVKLGAKGEVTVEHIPLKPMRDLEVIKGNFVDLTATDFLNAKNPDYYYQIILTDEEEVPDVMNRLRIHYNNIMLLTYDNTRTRTQNKINMDFDVDELSPIELFNRLYTEQNGQELSQEQVLYLQKILEESEDEDATS